MVSNTTSAHELLAPHEALADRNPAQVEVLSGRLLEEKDGSVK
jgi:hypothetical protein